MTKENNNFIMIVYPTENGGDNMSLDLSRLKAERIAKGLTQEEMAQKMGWSSRGPYTKRESGDIDIGVNEFLKIIAILGYSKEQAGIFFKDEVPKKERNQQ